MSFCVQPLGKGLLQRLLLNLCAHSVTRLTLLQLLLDMLRPEAEGIFIGGISADGAQSQRLYGCQWNVVYARSQMSDGTVCLHHDFINISIGFFLVVVLFWLTSRPFLHLYVRKSCFVLV